jgi:hypothetical protein
LNGCNFGLSVPQILCLNRCAWPYAALLMMLLIGLLRIHRLEDWAPYFSSTINNMEEHLAIKSDRLEAWRKKKVNQIRYDLRPRKNEPAKSSWSHVVDDDADPLYLLSCRPNTACKLHALALLIFDETREPGKKFSVSGVSVNRAAFEAGDVIEDSATHPVIGLEPTHRSLQTKDEQKVELYALKITDEDRFGVWEYDFVLELRSLLAILMDNGAIQEEYRPAAQRLIDRWAQ